LLSLHRALPLALRCELLLSLPLPLASRDACAAVREFAKGGGKGGGKGACGLHSCQRQRCPDALPRAQVAASRGAKMTTSRRRAPHPQARRSWTSAASKGARLRCRSPHFTAASDDCCCFLAQQV
jgi:hypothetical protein